MKKILLTILLLLTSSFNANAEGFMAVFEEIPLQDTLTEEEPFSYDTEEIRIIEQYVSSPTLTRDEFLKFYTQTLNSLGWTQIKEKANAIKGKKSVKVKISNSILIQFGSAPQLERRDRL